MACSCSNSRMVYTHLNVKAMFNKYIKDLIQEVNKVIQYGGESPSFYSYKNHAKAGVEFEDENENCHEIELKVQYNEYGGGSSPYDNPYSMTVTDIDMWIDGVWTNPNYYGITKNDFEL